MVAEYALRDLKAPLGIATYRLNEALPDALQGNLPKIEELEATLARADESLLDDDTE